jgi:transposase
MTYRDIAGQLNVGLSTVAKIICLWRQTGSITTRRKGRPPTNQALGQRTARLLVRESVLDPRATARQIRERTGGEASKTSLRTIQRYLRCGGRFPYRPRPGPTLNEKHKKDRLEWAKKYRNWTAQQWSKVGEK